MRQKNIISVVFALIISINVWPKEKVFFDSKADLVGVSGDVSHLFQNGYGSIILENPILINIDLSGFHKDNDIKKEFREKDIESYLNSKRVGKYWCNRCMKITNL